MNGSSQEEFEWILQSIKDHTITKKVGLKNLVVLNVIGIVKNQDGEDYLEFYYISPKEPIINDKIYRRRIPIRNFRSTGFNFDELLKETINVNRTMFINKEALSKVKSKSGDGVAKYKGEPLFFSASATKTLAQRVGMTYSSLNNHFVERDLYLARKMNVDVDATLIVKEYKNLKKVFGVMSANYPQEMDITIICDIYSKLANSWKGDHKINPDDACDLTSPDITSKLGKMECCGWNIAHNKVSIRFQFPEYAEEISQTYGLKQKMIPCVEFSNSDTGECSLRAVGYWKLKNGSSVVGDEWDRVHKGNPDIDSMANDIEESIFDKYTLLPQRLLELSELAISSPDFDENSPRKRGENRKRVCKAFDFILKELKVVSYISKARELQLKRTIDFGIIDEAKFYTAYDVVMDVFSLPDILNTTLIDGLEMSDEIYRKFRIECISKAAYVDFNKLIKKLEAQKLSA